MILAGDTGGTKTVLAECDDGGTITREELFHCAEFDSLEAILDKFLGANCAKVTRACFGVAGPVVGGVAKITNLPWTISETTLSAKLGGARVTLLNDLQATALGTLRLPPASFAVVQEGNAALAHGAIAVIAPGTGLGEAMLISDGTRYLALASEGGHADFAPATDEEILLLRYLRARYGTHVSYERVLSGNGIGDLYGFLRSLPGAADEPTWLAHDLAKGDRNAVISNAAIAGTDATCVRTLEMFAQLLGAEAGNLALRALATGGVVICGGIPPKILPALQTGALITRFADKGRFAPWMRTLPVRIALEPRAALLGAAHHAAQTKDQR